jgi:hypothetical protein
MGCVLDLALGVPVADTTLLPDAIGVEFAGPLEPANPDLTPGCLRFALAANILRMLTMSSYWYPKACRKFASPIFPNTWATFFTLISQSFFFSASRLNVFLTTRV